LFSLYIDIYLYRFISYDLITIMLG